VESQRHTILAVDDSEDILNLVELTLAKEHTVKTAVDGRTALKAAFERPRPDLILLDVEMGAASGYDVCRAIKATPALADIPVVFLTNRTETRDVVEGFQLGALDYLAKPISPPVLAARVRTYLELISRRREQETVIRERTSQLEQTRLQLIRRLGRAMEYHETSAVGNRVVRLGHYVRALAQAAGAKPEICDLLMKAAPLHDIGKVGVPANILRKTGRLSIPERDQMRRHPEIGAEIIGEHEDPLLKTARTLALTHHERWDGTGYPLGAAGENIPWAGRLMAIVDAFESMTATQFHRESMRLELAVSEITGAAGKQFDPALVEAFKKALPEFRKIHETYADQLGDLLNLDFVASPPKPSETPGAPPPVAIAAEAAQEVRDTDEAKAKSLAEAKVRLKVEHDLASAAAKDIVSQQAAKKRAEENAAREAELHAAARQRANEEAVAARIAQERAAAEAKAADLARQTREENERAIAEAAKREEAEKTMQAAIAERAEARRAAERSSAQRAAAEARTKDAAARTAAAQAAAAQADAEAAAQPAQAVRNAPKAKRSALYPVLGVVALGAAAAAFFFAHQPEPEPVKVAAPPARPLQITPPAPATPPAGPVPAAAWSDGAPLALRAESSFEKLPRLEQ
jgi:putative two-component system response regulator